VRRVALLLLAALLAAHAGRVLAEKADRDKPMRIEANRMTSDDTRRMTMFEGNVVVTKGTLTIRADRIVVRQDAEGFQHSTATGAPVRFKQRQDPKDGAEAEWIQGEALRIELDDRKSTIELFEQAKVTKGGDEVAGEHIFVDQRSDFFSVNSGRGGAPGGRVRAVLQPKAPAPDPKAPAPEAKK
jgi:lipopolysaccharide export system protein LptA